MPARKSSWIVLSVCLLIGMLAAGCSAPEQPVTARRIRLTPTPASTATPGPLTQAVDRLARSTGADRVALWGITLEDWLNTLVSLLIFVVIVLLFLRLLRWLLRRFTALTTDETDNLLLQALWPQVNWVVGILALDFSTSRLAHVSPRVKQSLDQLYKALIIIVLAVAFWKLVDFIGTLYAEKIELKHEEHQHDQVIALARRIFRLAIVVITVAILLEMYGVPVGALIAGLGIGGPAISLAAKDSLSNMISGLILMLDKPFRVGDRIEVESAGTWGDVIDIGLRSTCIRTADYRTVFIPNSVISTDQVINYSRPDSSLRCEIDFVVGYDPDLGTVRRIAIEAVRQVKGVLEDRAIDVLYVRMGDTDRILRVRWWSRSYAQKWLIIDGVNSAVQSALYAAGIKIPTNVSFRTANELPPIKIDKDTNSAGENQTLY